MRLCIGSAPEKNERPSTDTGEGKQKRKTQVSEKQYKAEHRIELSPVSSISEYLSVDPKCYVLSVHARRNQPFYSDFVGISVLSTRLDLDLGAGARREGT